MSWTNRARLRAGVLGLVVGCVPAVWLAGQVAAAPDAAPPAPAGGQQPGQPAVSPAQEELRAHFPFQSLAKRLAYEKADGKAPTGEAASRMTGATEKRLAALEERMESNRRNGRPMKLMQLHSDPLPQLAGRPAFGMFGALGGSLGQVGMLGGSFEQSTGALGQAPVFRLTREELELPPAPAIPFAAVRGPSSGSADVPPPSADRLAALHTDGLSDFLDPAGFGYVLDREHVVGFEPHQFRHMPEAQPQRAGVHTGTWAVVRLELVSLVGPDRPRVYVTDALPNLADAGRGAEMRPLKAFEAKGLKTLRQGNDLATEASGDRIRMLGSLRAGKQCVECHEVKRGDLLGALSWELQRQTVDGPPP
jgi:hypothetical protein